MKKLNLNRETVRSLSALESAAAGGAGNPDISFIYTGCNTTNPDHSFILTGCNHRNPDISFIYTGCGK